MANRSNTPTKNFIRDFVDTELEGMEVEDGPTFNSLQKAAHQLEEENIHVAVVSREGRTYLVNKDRIRKVGVAA